MSGIGPPFAKPAWKPERSGRDCGLALLVLPHETCDRGRQLRAVLLPVADPVEGQHQAILAGGCDGVVEADPLDEAAVATALLVGGDDVIERALLGAAAREADDDHIGILIS